MADAVNLDFLASSHAADPAVQSFRDAFPDAEAVDSVEQMVDSILNALGNDGSKCIGRLRICGHGAPGMTWLGPVGEGAAALGHNSQHIWGDVLGKLACKFCPDAKEPQFQLWSCYAGADQAGLDLLKQLRDKLLCATVEATVDVCWGGIKGEVTQRVSPDTSKDPAPIPKPKTAAEKMAEAEDPVAKEKKAAQEAKTAPSEGILGKIGRALKRLFGQVSIAPVPPAPGEALLAGFWEGGGAVTYRPDQVVAAQYLPVAVGAPSPTLAERWGDAAAWSAEQVRDLRERLRYAVRDSLMFAAVAPIGYLRIGLAGAEGGVRWLSPAALYGDGALLCPTPETRGLVYALAASVVPAG